MSVFYDNFICLCNSVDKSPSAVAQEIGLSKTAVTGWKRRGNTPTDSSLRKIADYFQVTTSYLLTEHEEQKTPALQGERQDKNNIANFFDNYANNPNSPTFSGKIDFSKYHTIPILGRVAAGLPIYAEQNIENYTLTDLNGGAEYFALRVRGDSMNNARIYDGDTVIVRRQDIVENGEIAVVLVGDNDATIKRFYATNSTVTLVPQSTNPIHQPQMYDTTKVPVRVLGKVVKSESFF